MPFVVSPRQFQEKIENALFEFGEFQMFSTWVIGSSGSVEINFMEEEVEDDRQLNSLIFKKSVEDLLQQIEEIAEQKPEEAETCKKNIL